MKQIFLLCGALLLVSFLLPMLTAATSAVLPPSAEMIPRVETGQASSAPPAAPPVAAPAAATCPDDDIFLRVQTAHGVERLSMRDVLLGLVAGEMPADFPPEALSAQAVAARTYILYQMAAGGKHAGADICADPACCAVYRPIASAAAAWGDSAALYAEKIARAVEKTDGEILLYDGKPILAVFFAVSSGQTERSADVWGEDLPYLQSVVSGGEEESPNFQSRVTVSAEQCRALIKKSWPEAKLGKAPEAWFGTPERTAAGGVRRISVGGVTLSGGQLRAAFGLRSANFTVSFDGESVIFDSLGYGHGVGMSQTGAAAMAARGGGYRDILAWYYPGAALGPVPQSISGAGGPAA